MCEAASSVRPGARHLGNPPNLSAAGIESGPDDELTTTSSIFEFLQQERRCDGGAALLLHADDDSELDIDSIFEEINRLSGDTRGRCVEDILREAEALISKQELGQLEVPLLGVRKTKQSVAVQPSRLPVMRKKASGGAASVVNVGATSERCGGDAGVEENEKEEDEEIEVFVDKEQSSDEEGYMAHFELNAPPTPMIHSPVKHSPTTTAEPVFPFSTSSRSNLQSIETNNYQHHHDTTPIPSLPSNKRIPKPNPPKTPQLSRRTSEHFATEVPKTQQLEKNPHLSTDDKTHPRFLNKSTSPSNSPSHSSPFPISHSMSFSRERSLEVDIERLQETLKDTEERLHSLRIQHDTLVQTHRELRDANANYVDEAERLQRDVQQLNECAAVLRNELQSARSDREEALSMQAVVQRELEETRADRKRAVDRADKDGRTIQDLQRQCREMERILMRKHPDSVSALIVASKNPSNGIDDQAASRKLLEQRIAQLEADAREQDTKAQQILSNVQTRFSSVQSKYEQHIGDLETQVISLQQINARLNEKIVAHLNRNHQITATQASQTVDFAEHETVRTSCFSSQTDPKMTGVLAVPVRARLNAKTAKPESTHVHNAAKDDAHLMATLRGMRVDLAIKEKAMQRLTRDLEECKKTMRKLQKERDAVLKDGKKPYDVEQSGDPNAIKEYVNKIKLLEYDYNALHSKRLQDLKTLQAAHERELSSCKETVRILQERLTDRDDAFAIQKQQQSRRQMPIDYMALKAKVSSLENRHAEREQRLHMLVDALSKGKLNGALDNLDGHKCK